MTNPAATAIDAPPSKARLPWFVCISPEYYDDACDTGFKWEGWAVDEEDAASQALEYCHVINDREPEDREEDIDPDRAKVHVAEIDFRRFAGPLMQWARATGNTETPLWKSMEAAVRVAGLTVVPFEMIEDN